jgi:carboxymethylenebutenolidase
MNFHGHSNYIYEGAQHAFNNDTNPGRYHPEAAQLAWKRTMEFLKEKLKA